MTSSLSLNNNIAPSNINNTNNTKSKLNANMATATTTQNGKSFTKNSKKIDEVREVIQNKPESDIVKVLEYFENDVGKTIDAFINDGGKEAIKKWSEIKSAKKNQNKKNNAENTDLTNGHSETNGNSTTTTTTTSRNSNKTANNKSPKRNGDENSRKDNNNNISNNKRNNNNSNKTNLNDLVASIINQYTTATPETDTKSTTTPIPTPIITNEVKPTLLQKQSHNQQQLDLLENLNNLVNSTMPKSLGDLKVKVLSIDQPTRYDSNKIGAASTISPALSSVTSSPSSMSVVSSLSLSSASTTDKQLRPSLLDLNKSKPNTTTATPAYTQRQFNQSYTNPNAKNFLEKSTKDLQRQTVALNKITTQFQDDLNKSLNQLNKSFNDLSKMLNERHNNLQVELNSLAQKGNTMLMQRQKKAAELKYLTDNAVHLDDNELLELKADIKHFISERQLDEEFTRIKCFQEQNLDKMRTAISLFGEIAQLNNQYATQRPPLNEVLNSASPTPTIPSNQSVTSQIKPNNQQQNRNGVKQTNNNSLVNNNNSHNNTNRISIDIDDEGEFIEVKRPQRNRNKQQQQQPPQPQQPIVNGQSNGKPYTNGVSGRPTNGTSNNNKKPQRNGDYAGSNKNNRMFSNGY